jgi:hypothetical protein
MAKLSNWQIRKLEAIVKTISETASIHSIDKDEGWKEAEFNLWAETWVIPRIKEVITNKQETKD